MGFYERQSQEDWEEAYAAGYDAGLRAARRDIGRDMGEGRDMGKRLSSGEPKKPRRKSAKQKLLQTLTDRKWKSYKRKYPKGKKTWVKIRAEVSRSMEYKKKAKRL